MKENATMIWVICIILFLCQTSTAQEAWDNYDDIVIGDDYVPEPELKSGYDPTLTTEKILRVNVHYILRDDNTGNFTEHLDCFGNNNGLNGYEFMEIVFNAANQRLANNDYMRCQTANPVPALPMKYRYQLFGVYFHRNTSAYNPTNCNLDVLDDLYRCNDNEAINVYFSQATANGGGCAYLSGDAVRLQGHGNDYSNWYNTGITWCLEQPAQGLNHEIAHNLSLLHTIRRSYGPCCDNVNGFCDDGCSDTPTWEELHEQGRIDICGFNTPGSCNNMLDYNAYTNALSPCQLGKIHQHIEQRKSNYLIGNYVTPEITISSVSGNLSLIASTVHFIGNNQINDGQRVIVDADNTLIDSNFEVALGGMFEIVAH